MIFWPFFRSMGIKNERRLSCGFQIRSRDLLLYPTVNVCLKSGKIFLCLYKVNCERRLRPKMDPESPGRGTPTSKIGEASTILEIFRRTT